MHQPTQRIIYTTAFVTPVVEHWLEREIAKWVHYMKDRSDDPSHHERTLLPRSYISLPITNETLPFFGPGAVLGGAGFIWENFHQGLYLYVLDKLRVDYTLARGPLGAGPS